jgi:hypothetical protein
VPSWVLSAVGLGLVLWLGSAVGVSLEPAVGLSEGLGLGEVEGSDPVREYCVGSEVVPAVGLLSSAEGEPPAEDFAPGRSSRFRWRSVRCSPRSHSASAVVGPGVVTGAAGLRVVGAVGSSGLVADGPWSLEDSAGRVMVPATYAPAGSVRRRTSRDFRTADMSGLCPKRR